MDRETGVTFNPGGTYSFQVDVTDKGEPGSGPNVTTPDTYAFRIWDTTTGQTYYQVGTPTAQVNINGGNVQVKP